MGHTNIKSPNGIETSKSKTSVKGHGLEEAPINHEQDTSQQIMVPLGTNTSQNGKHEEALQRTVAMDQGITSEYLSRRYESKGQAQVAEEK